MAANVRSDGIIALSRKAFDEDHADDEASTAALKAVANNLLLQESSRQVFADAGYAAKAADGLDVRCGDSQAELIYSRILFLLTYKTTFDFQLLFDKHSLFESIENNLDVHAERHDARPSAESLSSESIEIRALSETLKLVFNLSQFYPDRASSFQRLLEPMLRILSHSPVSDEPLQPPINFLINALLNTQVDISRIVDLDEARQPSTTIFPPPEPSRYVEILIQILESAVRNYTEDALETSIVPLLTLLRRIVEVAPEPVSERMCQLLLPSDTERDEPLGSSDTLASKLLHLSTTPAATQVREGISSLLFELSGKDPATFVRNVGYGYAAGYLMTHKIPLPESAMQGDVGERVTSVDGLDINPVTGQRRDKEPPDPSLDMTDEEKEREAERLFVLFERLKATGVVNVANPVEQAARSGKLESLENSDSE